MSHQTKDIPPTMVRRTQPIQKLEFERFSQGRPSRNPRHESPGFRGGIKDVSLKCENEVVLVSNLTKELDVYVVEHDEVLCWQAELEAIWFAFHESL